MELKGMKELAGTKTEQNLWKAFAGESQQEINILSSLLQQEKKVTTKSQLSLKKLQETKENTLKCGSNC